MEEDVVLSHLRDSSYKQRSQVLDDLRIQVRRNGGKLPLSSHLEMYKALSFTLSDKDWDVRHKCIQLINELVPQAGDELDMCMSVILHMLIPNMGDSKITIRRAVIQTLHVYMKHTENLTRLFSAIVKFGLENDDRKIVKEVTVALPMLFTQEFKTRNFFEIAQSLTKKLVDSSSDENNIAKSAEISLEKLKNLVGESTFNSYLQKLSPPLRKFYMKTTGNEIPPDPSARAPPSPKRQLSRNNIVNDGGYVDYDNNSQRRDGYASMYNKASPRRQISLEGFEFGIIPSHIMGKLEDTSNHRSRNQAMEELFDIVQDLEDPQELLPHAQQFISFLNNLLDDPNFKITLAALDILAVVVEKLEGGVAPYLKSFASAIAKRMVDNKIVIRQSIMKIAMNLMHVNTLSRHEILNTICWNLNNRNSRVRAETLNIVIATLSKFPSYEFDLGEICQTIAMMLVDGKRQVRQACMECFSLIAQAMGAGKLAPLVKAVDNVELNDGGDGVMAAVQARLARRQLPKVSQDGLVEYAITIPTSARLGSSNLPAGADIEWIMQASGGGGNSARSTRSDTIELESLSSASARSTPTVPQGPYDSPKRFMSAGRGKGKLPWEEEQESRLPFSMHPSSAPVGGQQSRYSKEDDIPPVKTKNTWEDSPNSSDGKKMKKRQTGLSSTQRDPSPDSNTYMGIYKQKVKFQTSEGLRVMSSTLPVREKQEAENAFTSQSAPASQRGGLYSNNASPTKATKSPFSTFSNSDKAFQRADLASSWPDHKPNKPKLDPISAPETPSGMYPPDWSESTEDKKGSGINESPIPMKPTLARGSASRRRKVPPIAVSDKGSVENGGKDSARDSAYAGSLGSTMERADEEDEMMLTSLRKIRNSASKKKAKKIWEKLEQQTSAASSRSPSPGDENLGESGIYSPFSTLSPRDDDSPLPWGTEKSYRKGALNGKPESPFESKPKLVSKKPPKASLNNNHSPESENVPMRSDSKSEISLGDYNPLGGATFRENHTSDVAIVGRGYSDDPIVAEPKPSYPTSKARERRRMNKGSLLSPLGMASMHSHGSVDIDDDKIPDAIVGRGMFDSSASGSDLLTSSSPSLEKVDVRQSRSNNQRDANDPPAIYGVRMKNNSQEDIDDQLESDDDMSNFSGMSMSKTMRDKMEQRQLQKQEESERRQQQKQDDAERRRAEKERKQREEKERQDRQKAREKMRLRQISQEDMSAKVPLGKPPAASTPPRRKTKSPPEFSPSYEKRIGSGTGASPYAKDEEELTPCNNPSNVMNDAMKGINNEDWEIKCESINNIRRLALHHPDVVIPKLHDVLLKLTAEVRNLRSQVSRLAIAAVGDCFANLKKCMDADLDNTVKVLLNKNGDSNSFIREDVDKALTQMVENVTSQRALMALVAGGCSHKNMVVRKTAAQHLIVVIEKMGPGRCMSGIKDVTDKVLLTAASFVVDNSPETRWYGRKIFQILMSHQDFDKMLNKYVTSNIRTVKDVVDGIRSKGLGDKPTDTPSAKPRRSGQGSRSRGSSAGSSMLESTASATPSSSTSSKRRLNYNSEDIQDMVKDICTMLSNNDYRERNNGIMEFRRLAEEQPDVLNAHSVKIFDKFIPRLNDSNSKVNISALTAFLELIPMLRDVLVGQVVNQVVGVVASNMASNNKEISEKAKTILNVLVEQLDGAILLQPFVNQASSDNLRIKPDMIEKLANLIPTIYTRKRAQVAMHVLPLVWKLIASGASNTKTMMVKLIKALHVEMGQGLIDAGSTHLNPRQLQTLKDLIDER